MCSSEIFPTTLRPSAMGLVTVGARLGGILAPFIVMLGDQHENLQFTVFGILSLAAGDSYASRRILWGIWAYPPLKPHFLELSLRKCIDTYLTLSSSDQESVLEFVVYVSVPWLWCNNRVEFVQVLQTWGYLKLWEDLCQTPWRTWAGFSLEEGLPPNWNLWKGLNLS